MKKTRKKVIVYDFFRRDRNEEDKFIGTLRERREKPESITNASIMNWAKLLAPKDVFEDRVYFVRVEI
jgi:hypothetical protein